MNAQRKSTDFEPSYVVLPGKMQRGELEGLLIDVSNGIGMSDSLLKSLLRMMRETRPSDWTNPTIEPVCFAMQSTIATALGKTDRAIRNDENALVKLGFIEKDVAANGSRIRLAFADGTEFRQGLSFSPLIEKVPDLMALRDHMQYERQHSTHLRRLCSSLKRNIKTRLMELQPKHPDHSDILEVAQTFLSWPTRYAAFNSQDALEDHHTEVLAISERIDELHQLLQKTSGQAEPHFRPYIQDTTEDYSVTCNASVGIRTPANAEDSNYLNAESDGSANCLEKRKEKSETRDNSKFMEKLTPQRLFWLSSKDMQLYITHHQGQRAAPSAMDFIQASLDLLVDLGINASAYDTAQEQMGDMATALCVLIIDRNRFHPETPIHNPGGVLRAMTKRHAAGLLNIVGSLIGITERDKQ